jgi:hypothetical protein
MIILNIEKPKRIGKSHYKAILYTYLYEKGFDVYIDVHSNALVRYTNKLKGYQKMMFDIVVYIEDKPSLVINFNPNQRRKTKTQLFSIPAITVDVLKFDKLKLFTEAVNILAKET